MGTYVLISDIHGNIDALRAVVDDIKSGPDFDEIICLGDIIGYCPGVNEVVELLASLGEQHRMRYNLGSHDGAALGEYQFVDLMSETDTLMLRAAGLEDEQAVAKAYFDPKRRRFVPVRPDARNAMNWTLEHMSDKSLNFLKERLELRIEIEPGIISVHGSPRDPACEYVRNAKFAQRCFESPEMAGVWLCFVGHTHLPVVWSMRRADIVEMAGRVVCMSAPKPDFSEELMLDRTANCYIVSIGAGGQPRDRDPRAAYARFSSRDRRFEHIRVEYDVDAAVARVQEAGFSERLAERLRKGE